jgi:hypothetical protein
MTKRMQGVLLSAALSALMAAPAAAQTIGSADIIDGSIQAIDIAPETITTGRIKNETIQAIDIAPESITTGRILNRTIKAIDIATESITTAEIKNESIHAIDLAPETITTGRIKNETIQAIDLAPESITTGRILNRTIKAIDIATESITTGEIKNGSIAGVDLANGAVTAAKLGLARTHFIEDSGADAANCQTLRDTLDGLVGPAAVLLGPGTYDCGANSVTIPSGVSLIGSGRNLTTITGNVASFDGLVRLAGDDIALAQLTVVNDGAGTSSAGIAISIGAGLPTSRNWRLRDVTAVAMNQTFISNAISAEAADCDGGLMSDVAAHAATAVTSAIAVDIFCNAGSIAATNLTATSVGADTNALQKAGLNTTLTVRDSALSAPRAASQSGGVLRLISSEIDGVLIGGSIKCVGNYDENGTALNNSCN